MGITKVMRKSTLVALGTIATLGSIAQNAQAVTYQIDLLLTPQSHLNLQAQVIMNNNKPGDGNCLFKSRTTFDLNSAQTPDKNHQEQLEIH
jgi:hypothetical protein